MFTEGREIPVKRRWKYTTGWEPQANWFQVLSQLSPTHNMATRTVGAVQPYSPVSFYWPSSAWWQTVGHHLVKLKWGSKAPKFYKGKKEGCQGARAVPTSSGATIVSATRAAWCTVREDNCQQRVAENDQRNHPFCWHFQTHSLLWVNRRLLVKNKLLWERRTQQPLISHRVFLGVKFLPVPTYKWVSKTWGGVIHLMSEWMRPPGHSGSLVSGQHVQKYLGTFACTWKCEATS